MKAVREVGLEVREYIDTAWNVVNYHPYAVITSAMHSSEYKLTHRYSALVFENEEEVECASQNPVDLGFPRPFRHRHYRGGHRLYVVYEPGVQSAIYQLLPVPHLMFKLRKDRQ